MESGEIEEDGSGYTDPDMALSHIDEKVQRVLGHFQKDFEGGVSADNLGPKFGAYGSFLPTYNRCPSIFSDPKTLQKDKMPTLLVELPLEGVTQKPKTPSKDPPSVRHNAVSSQDSSGFPLKDKTTTKTGHLSEQRSLKLRIKFSSNNFVQKKAADDSPVLLSGSSIDQSAGMPPRTSQDDMAESPTEILEIMTSELVPGGELVSPLHDSLFLKSQGENAENNDKKSPMPNIVRDKLEHMPLSNSKRDKWNSTEEIYAVTDASKSRDRMQSSELMKGNFLGFRSGQDSKKNDKQYSSSTLTERDSADNKLSRVISGQPLINKSGDKKSHIYKLKSRCPIEGGNNHRDSTGDTSLKQNAVNKCTTEGLSGQLSKNAKFNNCQIERNERSPIKTVVCDETYADLIDDWVMCDRCQKWRLLPFEMKPEHLPEKWLCSMLDWLPGMNRCDISEEETTNARNALYRVPVSVNGTAPGLGEDGHKLTTETIGNQEKKKQASKVTQQGGVLNGVFGISAKDRIRDSLKRKGLHDTTHGWPNSIKDSNAQQKKSLNLLNGIDAQQLKENCKLVAGQIGLGTGTSKKFKANVDYPVDKHLYLEAKSTAISFPNTAPGKCMQKKNRIDLPKAAKYGATEKLLVSSNKLGGHSKESSLKIKAMKECDDDQNCQTSVGSINREELSECGRSLMSKNKRKLSSASNADDKPMKKIKVMLLKGSSNGDRVVDRTVKAQICKDQKLKLRNKPLNSDLGSEMSKTTSECDEANSKRAKKPCYNEDNVQKACSHRNAPISNAGLNGDAYSHTAERNTSITSQFSSSSLATNDVLEKAKELIEYADGIKSAGFCFESNEAYFKAALEFLHGASLLDNCKIGDGKLGKSIQIRVYSDTAELCEKCGHEYWKRKEMAMAALAYKGMEVAYMNLIFCIHSSTNNERKELEDALKTTSQGSCVISAQTRQSFIRLLDFTQNVNLAMEASTKSRNALAAANETDNFDFVKRVIDFSFQNVEEFTQLVGRAMEAIKVVQVCR